MAQVKKGAVREAILASAFRRFAEKGYANTTLAQISGDAGISTSNLYVYFGSKLAILFALYDPWLRERLTALEQELAGMTDPRARLRRILLALWRDIPAEHNGFSVNLMQALSTATPDQGYSRDLLLWAEDRIGRLIRASLPPERAALAEGRLLAHVLMMAFDGFVLNTRLADRSRRLPAIAELMADLLLGTVPGQPGAADRHA
ncbi:MAG: TetR/AcrR family transcriptional regulator [Dongiaceae bacterium]